MHYEVGKHLFHELAVTGVLDFMVAVKRTQDIHAHADVEQGLRVSSPVKVQTDPTLILGAVLWSYLRRRLQQIFLITIGTVIDVVGLEVIGHARDSLFVVMGQATVTAPLYAVNSLRSVFVIGEKQTFDNGLIVPHEVVVIGSPSI